MRISNQRFKFYVPVRSIRGQQWSKEFFEYIKTEKKLSNFDKESY